MDSLAVSCVKVDVTQLPVCRLASDLTMSALQSDVCVSSESELRPK